MWTFSCRPTGRPVLEIEKGSIYLVPLPAWGRRWPCPSRSSAPAASAAEPAASHHPRIVFATMLVSCSIV